MVLGLPPGSVERVARDLGVERLSKKAVFALTEILNRYTEEVMGEAVLLALHAKRKTVMKEDIELAAKNFTKLTEKNSLKIFLPETKPVAMSNQWF